ncbi:hybrid sensor histidine kinase/response regulator [Vibrio sp. Isolate25]|uniref:hybrid sensor histidine kinase/response regulator n=1 Tax=Vibrio sp. Isolate25 TaxID=2908535 RepID=UPI001EFDC8F0|nr:hybrid sensor histidine kinase/response regulator [Vibrio sp. Isolate25]MCG9595797.1 hybrid sensor histidine kinase/response regulator [Vibrio sp. Isolate25]
MTAVLESVRKVYQYAEPNLTLVGWMGLLGFPTYYYVWSYLFPQPYENLALRLLCSALFAVIAFRHSLPKYLQKYMPQYYLVSIAFCLPCFFSFMMFMNQWSTIWAMSFMASIFLHILLVHQTRLMLLQAVFSLLIAFFAVYGFDFSYAIEQIVWPYIPIFLFTYVFGNLFYFRNQVEHESKVSIAKSFGAGIAHEMRNPLSALKASFDVLSSLLPDDKSKYSDFYPMSHQELTIAREVLSDADEVIQYGNETIDLLLTSIDENRVSTSTFKKQSLKRVIEDSLASFAYKSSKDKQSVQFHCEEDAAFFGSDTLIKYALYNLLKNAFYYQSGEDFRINIELRCYEKYNVMTFRDNGVGIAPDVLENIFKDFYTFGKSGSYGLGLPFCRKVMQAVGGKISCQSVLNEWTEFTLTFPKYQSAKVDHIKLDLMKSKSALYVGDTSVISRLLNEQSFYKGFTLNTVDIELANSREEYEFEYDLIFIDLDAVITSPNQLAALENKLHFTEARIVFLYDENNRYHNDIERHLTIYPVEKHRMLLEPGRVLDELFFESPEPDRNLLPRKEVRVGKTIVIADDNHSLRTYTSILLEQQGFEVIQAQNGQEVLDKLQNNLVDLVLMDIEMPQLNGLDAANAIRSSDREYANVPILGHTGDSTSGAIDKIHESGMNDYIIKPAGTEVLLDKISNWI